MNVKDMETYVSWVLRVGVLVSGLFLIMGMGLFYVTGDASCPYGIISLNWMLWGDPFWAPSHILFLGFMVLVGTPILRVVSSTIMYGVEHDWTYLIITGTVLMVLLIGILLGVG
jgi:uncharacterized membrane protein